jgi:hypothetical protein
MPDPSTLPADEGRDDPSMALEHDPEKWKPVFRKDHAQTRIQSMIRKNESRFSEKIMLQQRSGAR